jgi:hypothetical protein
MDQAQAQSECECPMCPTYLDCGERLAFCLWPSGLSKCITVERGCICEGCPVYVESEFTSPGYFCTRGPWAG